MMRPVFLVSPVAKIDRFPFRLSQLGGPDNDRRACVVRVAEGHRRSSPNVHILWRPSVRLKGFELTWATCSPDHPNPNAST